MKGLRLSALVIFFLLSWMSLPVYCREIVPPPGCEKGLGGESVDPLVVLEEDPGNLCALVEAARLMKKKERYNDAARYLLRAAEAGPPETKNIYRTEAATLLSWSGDLKRAIEVFKGVLDEEPADRDAGLGLARTLGWAKRYEEALSEFDRLLERNPEDLEVLTARAGVLAWSGRYDEAVRAYREVLDRAPDDRDAAMGLSRVLWWSGRGREAVKELDHLLELDPSDEEARALSTRIREDLGPVLSTERIYANDSDRNDLVITRAYARFKTGTGKAVRLTYSVTEASRSGASARADVLSGRVGFKGPGDVDMDAGLSITGTDTSPGGTTVVTGALSAGRTLYGPLKGRLSYSNYMLLDTVSLIENKIRVRHLSAGLSYPLRGIRLDAAVGYASYSDDNTRKDALVNISKTFTLLEGTDITAGYSMVYMDFSKDLSNGYFDPSNFFSNTINVAVKGALPYKRNVVCELRASTGIQSYNSRSEYTSALYGALEWRITGELSAKGAYRWSRSALETAAGFRYEEFRFGIEYMF